MAAAAKKAEGNDHFRAKRFEDAIASYTEAINLSPDDYTFYSNRSAAYAAIGQWEKAAEDGQTCITKNREWIKGYFRLATAQQNMGQYQAAIDTLTRGKAIANLPQQTRDEIANKVSECRAAIVEQHTQAVIEETQKLLNNNDIPAAYKMVQAGMQKDPNNASLQRLKAQVEPQFEQFERSRKASLSRTELLKEEGDALFKQASFELAIEKYTACLQAEGSTTSPLAIKCLLNRSACHKQLSNFNAVIDDTSYVLEEQPENPKALIRRAQAFEACERYRLALQDVRTALGLGISVIGQQNYGLCTSMQGRLERAIKIDRAQS